MAKRVLVNQLKIGPARAKWVASRAAHAAVRSRLHNIRMSGIAVDAQLLCDGHFLLAALDDAEALIELLLREGDRKNG
jgi:hypothetical protein